MASDRLTPNSRQRNPITQEAHRRQTFWQIYFPLITFGVLVIVAIVLAILAENQAASKWADISLIYMISVMMVIFIFIIAILIISTYYTTRVIKEAPYFFFLIHKYAYLIEIRVKRASNLVVEPILRLNGYIAGVRALRRK